MAKRQNSGYLCRARSPDDPLYDERALPDLSAKMPLAIIDAVQDVNDEHHAYCPELPATTEFRSWIVISRQNWKRYSCWRIGNLQHRCNQTEQADVVAMLQLALGW